MRIRKLKILIQQLNNNTEIVRRSPAATQKPKKLEQKSNGAAPACFPHEKGKQIRELGEPRA
jgi:hypothetical protein